MVLNPVFHFFCLLLLGARCLFRLDPHAHHAVVGGEPGCEPEESRAVQRVDVLDPMKDREVALQVVHMVEDPHQLRGPLCEFPRDFSRPPMASLAAAVVTCSRISGVRSS
jgi:hypothetical protein